jgi:iron(III) transport system substrate-binding protein
MDKIKRNANPHSSGTGYTALSTYVQLFGEDGAFKFLVQMDRNVTRYTKTGAAPGGSAARGKTMIGIGFMHDLAALVNQGFPLQLVEPCEGTGYEIGGVSIVKGAKNLNNAKKWVDYSLRADVQMIGYASHGFLSTPSNLNAEVPPEAPNLTKIKLIDYDFKTFGSPEMRRHLLKRWNKEVNRRAQLSSPG